MSSVHVTVIESIHPMSLWYNKEVHLLLVIGKGTLSIQYVPPQGESVFLSKESLSFAPFSQIPQKFLQGSGLLVFVPLVLQPLDDRIELRILFLFL